MREEEIVFEVLKLVLTVGAVAFTYFKFFREGSHKQRIQYDIDCVDLGVFGTERIIEIGCNAENRGNVEQKFDDIRVTVRGIQEGQPLGEIEGHEPRLAFPVDIAKASLISKKWRYFFVRPRVKQRFPLVVRLPLTCTHILVRSTFRYKGTKDIHSAERAFQLVSRQMVEQADADRPRR